MKINLKKLISNSFRLTTFSIFFLFTLLLYSVNAEDGVVKIGDLELYIWVPTVVTDLRKYGLLRFLGYIAIIFVTYLFGFVILTIFKIYFDFSNDESTDLKNSLKGGQSIMEAIAYFFVFLLVYAAISMFLGAGNLFNWPTKLSQCGDGEILFRAEYRAATINPELFKDEVLVYCCRNFEKVEDIPEDEKFETSLYVVLEDEEKNRTKKITDPDPKNGVAVGIKDDGGWLFVGDPGKGPNVIPVDISDAEDCMPFHF